MSNLLSALRKLHANPIQDLVNHYQGTNRANSMGDALETYVKDLFCNDASLTTEAARNTEYQRIFSYIGNQNNPPDIMLRGGDAIEVKKIETSGAGIALNSSYPKSKLYKNSPMLTQACRDAEDWESKDIVYVIGAVNENRLNTLWFVYGDCYAADSEIYERIKNKISEGLSELPDIELSETNELGRINKVDPLGITNLRIRGMWHIENPIKVYSYLNTETSGTFKVNALMLSEKYNSFPESDRLELERLSEEGFTVEDVEIKSPNNPASLIQAKLLKFSV